MSWEKNILLYLGEKLAGGSDIMYKQPTNTQSWIQPNLQTHIPGYNQPTNTHSWVQPPYKHTVLDTTSHTNTQSWVQPTYKHTILDTTNPTNTHSWVKPTYKHSPGYNQPTHTQLCVLQYSNYTVLVKPVLQRHSLEFIKLSNHTVLCSTSISTKHILWFF